MKFDMSEEKFWECFEVALQKIGGDGLSSSATARKLVEEFGISEREAGFIATLAERTYGRLG